MSGQHIYIKYGAERPKWLWEKSVTVFEWPRLKLHRTSVVKPEDGSSKMICNLTEVGKLPNPRARCVKLVESYPLHPVSGAIGSFTLNKGSEYFCI